jgi:hypothetical protein
LGELGQLLGKRSVHGADLDPELLNLRRVPAQFLVALLLCGRPEVFQRLAGVLAPLLQRLPISRVRSTPLSVRLNLFAELGDPHQLGLDRSGELRAGRSFVSQERFGPFQRRLDRLDLLLRLRDLPTERGAVGIKARRRRRELDIRLS